MIIRADIRDRQGWQHDKPVTCDLDKCDWMDRSDTAIKSSCNAILLRALAPSLFINMLTWRRRPTEPSRPAEFQPGSMEQQKPLTWRAVCLNSAQNVQHLSDQSFHFFRLFRNKCCVFAEDTIPACDAMHKILARIRNQLAKHKDFQSPSYI